MAFTWGNIERVFQDVELHAEFQREGFVTVPFLSPEQVARLMAAYADFHPEPVAGFHTTTFNQDAEYRRKVHGHILQEIEANIARIFEAYKVYFCSFISKAPGPKSELILHQDMTLLDESRFNGINIWCPLVDLDQHNGALQLLPGSHRIHPTYRGASLPDIYDGVEREVRHYMRELHLPAGTAVIFDQSIMHYSPPNLSGAVRPVINTFVAHADSEILVAFADRDQHPGQVELFRESDDFFFEHKQFGADIFARPAIGNSLGQTPYDFPAVTPAELAERYGPLPADFYPAAAGNQSSSSLLGRIFRIFNRN